MPLKPTTKTRDTCNYMSGCVVLTDKVWYECENNNINVDLTTMEMNQIF